jgi:hypothetical protein
MGLLRTILYAVIIYYIWKIVAGMIAGNRNSGSEKINNGDKKNDDGDYTDYEEIK